MTARSASPHTPRIAVITVSYGSGDVLPSFFSSIETASTKPLESFVADNKANSDDAVSELAAQYGIHYLPMAVNEGYGGAINAAVEKLPDSIEWILVSNPDLVIEPGAVDALVATGDSEPLIGAVGPATLTASGEIYPSARAVPSLRTGVGHALFANFWIDNPWSRAYRNDTDLPQRRRDVGWLSGSCVLVRKSAFNEVNGFDAGFFMYFEDVDLGYRLGRAGYRNVYEPSAVVTHTGAHSTGSDSGRMIAAHLESALRFLNKKYSGIWLWPVRVALTLGLKIRSAIMTRNLNHR
ncbi:MAG: glycosyltransferase family 2 protein [Lacisediminihabitans sp.]